MKLIHLGALLGASALLIASNALADPIRFRGPVTLPSGIVVQGEVEVSSDSPLPVTGGGGGGGGGAVTAAANSYALGAIVDLGTGSSPGANTTNGYLKANGGYLSSLVTNTTGLATSTLQTTANTSLATIATNSGTQATAANQTAVTGSKAPGTAAASATLTGCVYTSAGVTLTNGQQAALQCNSTGQLITSGSGGGGGAITAASGSYAAGAFAAGSGVDGWNLTEGAKGDGAWTSGSGSMVAILKAIAGFESTTASNTGGAIPTQAPTVDIGAVGISQTTNGTTNAVAPKAAATGGATPLFTASLSTTVTAIKSSAGSLYMLRCYNPNATVAYAQVFNVASGAVTLGTTAPTQSYAIAPTSTGGFASAIPVGFSTAMSYAATTTSTGSTAPGTALSCNLAYQ